MTKPPRDPNDVLPKKDNVTRSSIGLQQWGDEPMGDAIGTGGSGTAERAARIKKGQTGQEPRENEDGKVRDMAPPPRLEKRRQRRG